MLGDQDLALPARMMDLHAMRQKLGAHNIANAEVSGFRKLSAHFGDEFLRAAQSGDVNAMRQAPIRVTSEKSTGIDSEAEVAGMTKNEVLFSAFAEIASFRLRMLRTAITSK